MALKFTSDELVEINWYPWRGQRLDRLHPFAGAFLML